MSNVSGRVRQRRQRKRTTSAAAVALIKQLEWQGQAPGDIIRAVELGGHEVPARTVYEIRREAREEKAAAVSADSSKEERWDFWDPQMPPEDARLVMDLPDQLRAFSTPQARRYVRLRRAYPRETTDLMAWAVAVGLTSLDRAIAPVPSEEVSSE
jgi:hypothetical protein